ncbi:MAG TPA: GGDEF domain-containing protein [Acidimicrobiales bacterium]|nr:GGDEF domain-containing protein [Acidimicrobiales bacterium]
MPTTSIRSITDREDFLLALGRTLHGLNVPVAVAMTDLDDFAEINDLHGFDVGDRVLESWERVMDANLPSDATVARLGGDEYAVILPGCVAETALILLDEIRAHFFEHETPTAGRLSASIGVASIPPHGANADELAQHAGQALMRAKRDGRNRVAIYIEEKMVLKSNYYSRGNLERLAKLSEATDRTEASLLREALDSLIDRYRDVL